MTRVYITEKAMSLASRYDIDDILTGMVQEYADLSLNEVIGGRFKPIPPYFQKTVKKNLRIIAKVTSVSGKRVVCILTILRRGDEAENFYTDPKSYGKAYLEELIDQNKLEEYVNNNDEGANDPPLASLPDELKQWWHPLVNRQGYDNLVMESEDWIQSILIKPKRDYWQNYLGLISAAVQKDENEHETIPNSNHIYFMADDSQKIIYYTICNVALKGGDDSFQSIKVTFLIDLFDDEYGDSRTPFEQKIIESYSWIDDLEYEGIITIDDIASNARHGYQELILADKNLWLQLQGLGDKSANLALSAEETSLLARIRSFSTNDTVLPVFINGRAGSGKSTILHYLFADYINHKNANGLHGDLLFLTYSTPLLNAARENVKKLLFSRSDFLVEKTKKEIEESLEKFRDYEKVYFQDFSTFIRSQIPAQYSNQFAEENFVDFHLFKRIYMNEVLPPELKHLEQARLRLPINKEITPDVSWHVLRTFIKGYSWQENLTPEEYSDIPAKEKSVSDDIYKEIFDEVWTKWYREITTPVNGKGLGFWDAQDLVVKILKENWFSAKYAVLFCDEAQDFTRVEINLILSLLIYHKYDLGWDRNIRLPFALAGDPLQTLNPTGFRWKAIKASFYGEVIRNLDPEDRGLVDMDYQELMINYRSDPNLVFFSNAIQLWRNILFDSNVNPQLPWWREQSNKQPLFFTLNKTIDVDKFMRNAQRAIVIVPCENGQEKEFILSDDILSSTSQSPNTALTILSPAAAKGLEFDNVILYKFGEYCPEKIFPQKVLDDKIPSQTLANEYFLNNLYVGVTRTVKNLWIIDTEAGERKLWQYFREEVLEELRTIGPHPGLWKHSIIGWKDGSRYPREIEERDITLQTAENLESGGLDTENSDLLRQAGTLYRRAGNEPKGNFCDAKALEFDGYYKDAGRAFEKIGRIIDAERCYWKGLCWPELSTILVEFPGGSLFRRLAVQVITTKEQIEPVLSLLEYLLSLNETIDLNIHEQQFKIAIRQAFVTLTSEELSNQVNFQNWLTASELLEKFPQIPYLAGLSVSAHVYYSAKKYLQAIELWEIENRIDHHDYYLAKAQISTDYPKKIQYLLKAGETNKIEAALSQVELDLLPLNTRNEIAKIYRESGKYKEAVSIYLVNGLVRNALEDLLIYINLNEKPLVEEEAFVIESFQVAITKIHNEKDAENTLWFIKNVVKSVSEETYLELVRIYLRGLVDFGMWERAINHTILPEDMSEVLDDPKNPDWVRPMTLPRIKMSEFLGLRCVVIRGFAFSDAIADMAGRKKIPYAKFISLVTSKGYDNWEKFLSMTEMGATIEKLWVDTEILDFYEKMEANLASEHDLIFVRQRWVKVKLRHISRIEKELKDVAENKRRFRYQGTLEDHLRVFDSMTRKWKISTSDVADLPKYPYATPYEMSFSVQWNDPVCKIINITTGGELNIQITKGILMPFGRVNLFEDETEDDVKFSVKEWNLSGNVVKGKAVDFVLSGRKYSYP